MAIQLNGLNDSALSALANQHVPYLNLPLADKSPTGEYLKGQSASLFQQQQLKQLYDQQQQQMAIEQYKQQQQMAQAQYTAKASLFKQLQEQGFTGQQNDLNRQKDYTIEGAKIGLDQQRADQLARYQQGQLGIDQQNADTKSGSLEQQKSQQAEELKIKQAHQFLLEHVQMNKEKSMERSGYAMGLIHTSDDKTQKMIIDQAVEKKILTSAQAEGLKKLSPKERQDLAVQDLTAAEAVASFKSQQSPGSSGVEYYPDGSIKSVTQGATKPTLNDLQKNIVAAQQGIAQYGEAIKGYQKEFLTYAGASKAAVGNFMSGAPDFVNKPLTEVIKAAGGDPSKWGKFASDRKEMLSQLKSLQFTIMKQLSGVQYSDQQLAQLQEMTVDSRDNPAEFEGKSMGFFKTSKVMMDIAQKAASQGISMNSAEGNKIFEDTMKTMKEQGLVGNQHKAQYLYNGKPVSKEDYEETRNAWKKAGRTDEQINKYLSQS